MKANYKYYRSGKIVVEVSDEEIESLNKIREKLIIELNNYAEDERVEIDLEVSKHLTNEHKQSELFNLRHHIITDLDYNKEYKDLISLKTGYVEFEDHHLFLLFARSYNILDDIDNGLRVLKNIIRVLVIERMLEFDYANDQLKVQFFGETKYDKKFLNVFTPYGFELFHYIEKNWSEKKLPTKYSEIYHFMNGYRDGMIHPDKTNYRKFIKKHSGVEFSKVLNGKNDKRIETYLKELREKHIKITGAPL